jgi:hypothetical protein
MKKRDNYFLCESISLNKKALKVFFYFYFRGISRYTPYGNAQELSKTAIICKNMTSSFIFSFVKI